MTLEQTMSDIANIQNELISASKALEQFSDSDVLSDDDLQEIEKMNDNINMLIDKLEKLIDNI